MMGAAAQPARVQGSANAEIPGSPESRRRIPTRPIKIAVGAALLLAGAYGIFSEHQFIASDNAVVTAYVVEVRTPIEGTVSNLLNAVGARVSENSVIGHVENPRVDQQHLQNLRDIEEQARSSIAAIVAERDNLQKQRQELLSRAGAHIQAVSTRLRLQTAEAQGLLTAKQAALKEATIEFNRGQKLHDAGIISDADLDKLQAQFDVATQEFAAQQADLGAVREEADAASRGIMIEPGINDVAYSRQRADEIDFRLSDIDRNLVALRSQANQASKDVQTEAKRAELVHDADLVAPASGVLWKLNALNGEHISAGEPVLQIVDCSKDFILVEVPQDRVPEIVVGGKARFRLSGESSESAGVVLSVSGQELKDENENLAAFPPLSLDVRRATIRVGVTSAARAGECLVGRTARVLLPASGGSPLSRWYQHFF